MTRPARMPVCFTLLIVALLGACAGSPRAMTKLNVYRAHGRGDVRFLIQALAQNDALRIAAHTSLLWLDDEIAAPALMDAVANAKDRALRQRAAVILGQKRVKKAIPLLLTEFSKLGHARHTRTVGVDVVGGYVQGDIRKELMAAVLDLDRKLGRYVRFEPRFQHVSHRKLDDYGNVVPIGVDTMTFWYEVHIAGYALWLLTGQDFGTDRANWQTWWEAWKKSGEPLAELPGAFPRLPASELAPLVDTEPAPPVPAPEKPAPFVPAKPADTEPAAPVPAPEKPADTKKPADPLLVVPGQGIGAIVVGRSTVAEVLAAFGRDCKISKHPTGAVFRISYLHDETGTYRPDRPGNDQRPSKLRIESDVVMEIGIGAGQKKLSTRGGIKVGSTWKAAAGVFGPSYEHQPGGKHDVYKYPSLGIEFWVSRASGTITSLFVFPVN